MASVSQFLNKNEVNTHTQLLGFFKGLLVVLTSLKTEAFVGAKAAADVLRSAGWGDQGVPMPHSQPHQHRFHCLEQAMNPTR